MRTVADVRVQLAMLAVEADELADKMDALDPARSYYPYYRGLAVGYRTALDLLAGVS